MPFTSAAAKRKRSRPAKKKAAAKKRKYAITSTERLVKNPHHALFLDPGLGKTKIFLDAFEILKKRKRVRRVLVVAKSRICHNVWPKEIEKWGFGFSWEIIENLREARDILRGDAEIILASYEMLPKIAKYLERLYMTDRRIHWLCFDESTKMKSPSSQRFNAIKHKLKLFDRRTIMTGTPTPHSYIDLWAQIYCLDEGKALGNKVGRYRINYFLPCGYEGRQWCLADGAEETIVSKIVHLITRFDRSQIRLPSLNFVQRAFDLSSNVRKQYDKLERDFILEVEAEGIIEAIEAVSSGAASVKLRQLVGGAVYNERKRPVWVHDEKIEELRELIDELQGEPLLVAYEFKHEIDRLRKEFPNAKHIGAGVNYKQGSVIEDQWNAGEIELLFANPASVGHGLNMQGHGCHVAIFTGTWNWENYTQFIQRVWRSGQRRPVTVHQIIARDTVDEIVAENMNFKEKTQTRFYQLVEKYARSAK